MAELIPKSHSSKVRREQSVSMKPVLIKDNVIIAALKPKNWKKVSVKHAEKLELLSKFWRYNDEDVHFPEITIINDNGVCFQEEFLIGRGSYGTEVYVCLGTDGIERAIKRLPKFLCNLLKNERDILTSQNAVEWPRVVNYHFYDDASSPDFGYLILNLYEQNLEDFVKSEGENITESRAREMIRQVLKGLKALHAREPRIIHRDLKPTNILVDVNGDLVLSDFGIGRFFPEQGNFFKCKHYTNFPPKYTGMRLLDLWQRFENIVILNSNIINNSQIISTTVCHVTCLFLIKLIFIGFPYIIVILISILCIENTNDTV